jgi:mono/diheme cytochrome c family protein
MEVDMFYRSRISIGLSLLLTLLFVVPVLAGGWAVITLDELPTGVVAGKPLTIGFIVLQHGRTPMTDIAPTITAKSSSGEKFVVNAEPDGKPGHYTATLTFPKDGDWQWSIQAFTMDQPMPVLSVSAPAVASGSQPAVKTEPATASISPLLIVRSLALVVGFFGLVIAYRRRGRLAMALTATCLLVGVASFMVGATTPEVEAQSKSSSESLSDPSVSQVELGRQLFIAKGCITCHNNTRAAGGTDYWTIDNGAPNLSKFSASPEALRLRLKDPSSVKSDTQMPNLNLSEAEIEVLIAFINSK